MKPKFQPARAGSAHPRTSTARCPTCATSAQSIRISRPSARCALGAEAADQPAGEEARPEHRQHMPLDAERRLVRRKAAADDMAIGAPVIMKVISAEGGDGADHAGDEARLRKISDSGRGGRSPAIVAAACPPCSGSRRKHRIAMPAAARKMTATKAPANITGASNSRVKMTTCGPSDRGEDAARQNERSRAP